MELRAPPTRAGDARASGNVWFHRGSISVAEIAVQTFAVVLGILLALAIDDWKNARETARGVAEAYAALAAELNANRGEMQAQRQHLRALAAALDADAATPDGAELPCNRYPGFNGIGTPLLLDAAYHTAISTQAFAHMDFAGAETIAAAYGKQARYADYHGKFLDLLLRAQPLPPETCRGIVEELDRFADSVDTGYAVALAAANRH